MSYMPWQVAVTWQARWVPNLVGLDPILLPLDRQSKSLRSEMGT